MSGNLDIHRVARLSRRAAREDWSLEAYKVAVLSAVTIGFMTLKRPLSLAEADALVSACGRQGLRLRRCGHGLR